MNYNTILFIDELKFVLKTLLRPEELFRGELTDEKLGLILGYTKNHIRKKRYQIRKNPDYLIPLDVLNSYSNNLICCYGSNAQIALNVIEKYCKFNDVPNAIYGIHKYHPELRINYFERIDNKEKAYWLGWLFAEGWLSRQENFIRFGVEIHKEDQEDLLVKFAKTIGFNLEYLDDEIKRDGNLTDYVRIRFVSDKFAEHLINHCFVVGKEKSKSIELPHLDSRELYLAFLLGYYDGDGKVGTTIITSGSIRFINQIKKHFNIPHKIWRTDSEWEGVGYNIYLGMDLMREMLANYKNSLPRKRSHLE